MRSALTDILISVDHRHAANMLLGKKRVEIRRRRMLVEPGTRVWVYSKLPRGRIELVATVKKTVVACPETLWRGCGKTSAVSRFEFLAYLRGVRTGFAIHLSSVKPIRPALGLKRVRRASVAFRPPQFFKRLSLECPELKLFLNATKGRKNS